jgi:hypothetical protein
MKNKILNTLNNNFYSAWRFLVQHPMFFNPELYPNIDNEDRKYYTSFHECLCIDCQKVNAITHIIDDIKKLNTHTEIWLECGPMHYVEAWGQYASTHDCRLDCGGDTFEDAIIKLAKLVKRYYNKDGSRK